MKVSVGVLKGDACVYEKKMDPYSVVTYSDGEVLHYGGREFKLFVGVGYECAEVTFTKDNEKFSNTVTFQLFSDNQWNYVTTFPATDVVRF